MSTSDDAISQHMRQRFDFLCACNLIGGVSGSNGRYQDALFRSVEKRWRTMTVEQLLDAIEDESARFNRLEALARNES